jgi:3-hydroxyisobutyrate dehydrogenase-like beta-hydroxyacid dehydrogenase
MAGKRVGFIGLGNMGKPMAVNLAKAGFDLTVYDVRPEPLGELRRLGATVAPSVAELAAGCDVVALVVVNDAQVEEVTLGEGGVLSAAKPGTIVVIHSTVHPQTCRKVADRAKEKGVGVLDAAVSGGDQGAKAATLTLMVGGEERLLDECRPMFAAVGRNIFHLGDVGMGQAGKLANNLIFFVNLLSASEGIRLGLAAGIEQEKLLELVKVSTGGSWIVENWEWFARMREAYTTGPGGLAEVAFKDLWLALSVGHDLKIPLPGAALTSQRLDSLLDIET